MNSKKLIGREEEIQMLEQCLQSNSSQFVAVYGRRRVGKTFLIKKFFKEQYTFQVTGLSRGGTKNQLANFTASMSRYFSDNQEVMLPKNWFEAFQQLITKLETSSHKKKIIFIDELPWLDTQRSDFITGLEHFWNGWADHRDDILLVTCGSATSWMINKLINDRGGLHNRVTKRIHLHPFTLKETEAFLKSNGGKYDRYQITQLYMAMGGVPFYLENIDVKRSVAQNIDQLFFHESGFLKNEFYNLFRSLFKKEERHIAIIEALAKKSKGLTRTELAKFSKLKNGGGLTRIIKELEQCGFIRKYSPFGKKKRGSLFQLIDQYSLFYLKYIKDQKAEGVGTWLMQSEQPTWRAWSGYAFEQICFYHIQQIKKALGISGIYSEVSSWRSEGEAGAQVDLVIDRRDRVINLCEIKFSVREFSIDKSYAENLKKKVNLYRQESKTTKAVFLTFITANGLKSNSYAMDLVQNEVDLNALFE